MPKTYDLNGANALSAALWFLTREEYRHEQDLKAIRRDISALQLRGVKMPKTPEFQTFFRIPGVDYDETD